MTTLANRLHFINDKIHLEWLNNSNTSFKLECKIIINHSIQKFLKSGIQLPVSVNLSNIKLFNNNNCDGHSTDSNGFIHNITGNNINSTIISYLVNDVPVIKESVFISNIV